MANVIRLRQSGWSYQRLGDYFNVSPTTILNRLSGSERLLTRLCRLPECGRVIKTYDPRRVYCTYRHAKLDGSRRLKGLTLVRKECALPECSKQIWAFQIQRKYCCTDHADLDWRRWKKHAKGKGIYARLLFGTPKCIACGETAVLDEHHVKFTGMKSDPASQRVYLCPTHHMLIHRGLAKLDENGVYLRLDATIIERLKIKQADRVRKLIQTGTIS